MTIILSALTQGSSSPTGDFRKLDSIAASFNGVTTSFALTCGGAAVTPVSPTNLIISLSGILQEPTTSYTISGTNIVFTIAPTNGETFFGVILGYVAGVGIPSDGTITAAKLAVAAIDLATSTTTGILPIVKGGTNSSSTPTAGQILTATSSTDSAWQTPTSPSLTVVIVSSTTQTATAGNHYVLTNVAATTLTLPLTPASGDTVAVTPDNALTTNIIGCNGQTIMGVAGDMTVDNANATVMLRFLNSTWRII